MTPIQATYLDADVDAALSAEALSRKVSKNVLLMEWLRLGMLVAKREQAAK